VFWELFQFPLDQVARIEVIRGPASSSWGPNGVNGVINIVTKSAASTQGARALIGGGNFEGPYAQAQYGGATDSQDLFYRAYALANAPREFEGYAGRAGNDAASGFSAGFRLDGYLDGGARWDVSTDFSNRRADGGQDYRLPNYLPPAGERIRSASMRGRYVQPLSMGGEMQFQAALARTEVTVGAVSDNRNTIDFDFQHRNTYFGLHEILWGVNYRYSTDRTSQSPVLSLDVPNRSLHYLGAFVQDEIQVSDRLKLTLALRADESPLTKLETQPSARATFVVSPTHTVWASASQAARAPSRGEIGLNLNLISGAIPSPTGFPAAPALVPLTLSMSTDPSFGAERLRAFELGWRSQWTPTVSTDLTLFHHAYSDLRGTTLIGAPVPTITNPPVVDYVTLFGRFVNVGSYDMTGMELSADWRVNPALKLQLAAWINEVRDFKSSEPGVRPPKITASLRVSWKPSKPWNVDLWLRHARGRSAQIVGENFARAANTALDARLSYALSPRVELALIGKNLTDSACDVYRDNAAVAIEVSSVVPTCLRRAVAGEIRAEF
jgi:iron complex outermembrane receptor protein